MVEELVMPNSLGNNKIEAPPDGRGSTTRVYTALFKIVLNFFWMKLGFDYLMPMT